MAGLPALLSVADIHERLQSIFPEGSPNRSSCVWEIAARTIFVMLYVGAIEGQDVWIRPDQVITFPNGETRRMVPGPSAKISKAIIEDFSKRFLIEPGVIFLSESANKVVARDDQLAKSLNLSIEADKKLADIIMADLGPSHPFLVFVEVAATDGPVNEMRKAALQKIAANAGFSKQHVVFVTAYLDCSDRAFKKTVDALSWGTFAWFASEPDKVIVLYAGQAKTPKKLIDFV